MDPKLSLIGIAVFAPAVILVVVAMVAELSQRWRDRADDVLMTWDDLRLTPSHLIVGSRRDAERIPLNGLTAIVDMVGSPGQDGVDTVHLTIENASHEIRRSQPYSYGASGNAQAFAIRFNLLSDLALAQAAVPDNVVRVARWDRRAA
ncbi:hypothetical protein AB4Z42_01970 [Mycobacterium sp. 2YAF39]|uniref:hypothetical protein n=1 Tax=Mycobacterium sp. 2YAF39 TaxID=3233033 RepID=UPI003F956570